LLRIILVGQPELLEMLGREELRQVDQRITARYHLSPLSRQETSSYIQHRLAVAGIRENLFSPLAMRLVHRFSGGVPRMINTICERSLLAVFSRGESRVNAKLVWQAAKEVKGRRRSSRKWPWFALGLVMVFALLALYLSPLSMMESGSTEAVSVADEKIQSASIPEPANNQPLTTEPKPDTEAPVELNPASESDAVQETKMPLPEVTEVSLPAAVTTATTDSTKVPEETVTNEEPEGLPAAQYLLPTLFEQSQKRSVVYQRLFYLWQHVVNLNSPLTPCMQASQKGLRCLRDSLEWEQLHSLNRPFIFRLKRDKQSRMLLLKRLEGDRLLVDDGSGEVYLKLADIQPYWNGEFVMLWRPHGGVALIGDGSTGEAVTWLRDRLQLADGEPTRAKPGLDEFDENLKVRLQAFQQTKGLITDGMAGQRTLVYLNNLSLPAETPTLYPIEKRGG
jgi:general secretion pathway protein A